MRTVHSTRVPLFSTMWLSPPGQGAIPGWVSQPLLYKTEGQLGKGNWKGKPVWKGEQYRVFRKGYLSTPSGRLNTLGPIKLLILWLTIICGHSCLVFIISYVMKITFSYKFSKTPVQSGMSLSIVWWALVSALTAPGNKYILKDLIFNKLEGIHCVIKDLGIWSSHKKCLVS